MTYFIYACPPASCIANCTGCTGHEFAVKGISGCVNTSVAVGTVLRWA
jgi:hypothetical protein